MRILRANKVATYEVPHAPHDILLGGNILGFEKEMVEAANVAQTFIESVSVQP